MELDINNRQVIINSASVLFYKNGFINTSIKEIADKAELEESTVNSQFSSKENICLEHLKLRNEEFTSALSAFMRQIPPGNNKVLAIFSYLELFYKMEDFNGCWNVKVFSEVNDDYPLIKSEVLAQKEGLLKFIESLIANNCCISKNVDSEILAQQVYLLLESAVAQSNILKKEWPITTAKELCSDLLNKAIN